MNCNNRQRPYVPKVYPKRKFVHTEVKNGVTVFVEGRKKDPYEGILCSSLSLRSRIDTGVFQDLEGVPHKLEKAQGCDIMSEEVSRSQKEFEKLKEEYEVKLAQQESVAAKKKLREAMLKAHPELVDVI